jgi:hypothetical protein
MADGRCLVFGWAFAKDIVRVVSEEERETRCPLYIPAHCPLIITCHAIKRIIDNQRCVDSGTQDIPREASHGDLLRFDQGRRAEVGVGKQQTLRGKSMIVMNGCCR